MIIQIYEIQNPEEASALIRLGVDHIGSVLLSVDEWKNSDVKATIEMASAGGAVSSLIPLFGDPAGVLQALEYYRPDIVHFCDVLSGPAVNQRYLEKRIQLQQQVRRVFPTVRIMRSIPVGQPGNASSCPTLPLARTFESVSDLFLTDTLITAGSGPGDQPVAGFIGITGQICDWQMARQLVRASRIPVVLAGGIGPQNVFDAIETVKPYGVDSCTGTNLRDGRDRPIRFRKDMHRVAMMVAETRRAGRKLAQM